MSLQLYYCNILNSAPHLLTMVSKTKKTKSHVNAKTAKKQNKTKKQNKQNPKNTKYQWHFKVFDAYIPCEQTSIVKVLNSNIKGNTFNKSDLLMSTSVNVLNNLSPPIKYRRGKNYNNTLFTFTFLHHGQRKLFNTELYMLSNYLKSHDEHAVVVYAGAAAGVHFPYLSSLFPNVDFHLYDPARFAIKETSRIHIYNEFFTDDVASSWGPNGSMRKKYKGCHFFLCDIRVDISDLNDNAREAQVTEDMQRQQRWAQLAHPMKASMLKFRPPYDSTATLEYLPGKILWQTWPGKASGETRLITESAQFNNKLVKYDVGKYEDMCAYHNMVYRPYIKYTDLKLFKSVPGYDGGWDARAEAETWKMYININAKLTQNVGNIAKKMNQLTKALKQPLIVPYSYHGRYSDHIHGNRWLWMITRSLERIDREKMGAHRRNHETNRVKGLGVKGYLVKR